jgi:hypothetical protein
MKCQEQRGFHMEKGVQLMQGEGEVRLEGEGEQGQRFQGQPGKALRMRQPVACHLRARKGTDSAHFPPRVWTRSLSHEHYNKQVFSISNSNCRTVVTASALRFTAAEPL